ncbi:MAG: hypothetical protein QOJ65_324 [Fimbriimonadaceae bacterium]|nr:hypothetical protein [Fimbriimonadaceae bacterium]
MNIAGRAITPTPGQAVLHEFTHYGIPVILVGALVLLIIRTILLKVELSGPGFTLKTERNAVAEMLSDLLADVRELTREEKDLFMRIRNRMSRQGKVTVGELFPDFAVDGDPYRWLRSLQCSHLIRPARGGKWDKDSFIQVTTFGERLAIARPNLFTPAGSPMVHD